MSIELLRNCVADIVDENVTECVFWEEEEKKEKEKEEDCEACRKEKEWEEEEEEWCNTAINEVKRPRIALRSLKECEKVKVNDSADNSVM